MERFLGLRINKLRTQITPITQFRDRLVVTHRRGRLEPRRLPTLLDYFSRRHPTMTSIGRTNTAFPAKWSPMPVQYASSPRVRPAFVNIPSPPTRHNANASGREITANAQRCRSRPTGQKTCWAIFLRPSWASVWSAAVREALLPLAPAFVGGGPRTAPTERNPKTIAVAQRKSDREAKSVNSCKPMGPWSPAPNLPVAARCHPGTGNDAVV